jgi:hypothetical protein
MKVMKAPLIFGWNRLGKISESKKTQVPNPLLPHPCNQTIAGDPATQKKLKLDSVNVAIQNFYECNYTFNPKSRTRLPIY